MTLTFIIQNFKWNRLLAILVLISFGASAQKDAQFSLFSLNQLYLNPAAAGADGLTKFQLTHRTQYAGYQGTNPVDEGGGPPRPNHRTDRPPVVARIRHWPAA